MNKIKIHSYIDFSLRLDIIVKYIFIQSHEEKKNQHIANEIYLKHIEAQNSFIEDKKNSKDVFLKNFHALIKSMKKNSYVWDHVIEIWKNNSPLDWAHRIACWLYFWIELPYKILASEKWITWDVHWFQKYNFSKIEILFILWVYQEITWYDFLIQWPCCGVSKIKWETLRYEIKNNEYHIKENILDIYSYDRKNIKDSGISYKSDVVSSYWFYNIIFLPKIDNKMGIRSNLLQYIKDTRISSSDAMYYTIHSYDDENEKDYMKKILFSPEYWKHLSLRQNSINNNLLKLIRNIPDFDTATSCIVWSWSLWLYNLCNVSDIDIIKSHPTNSWIIKENNNIDILDYEYSKRITNSDIITSYSFIWRWYNFISLHILAEIKSTWLRTKDLEQAKKIYDFLESRTKSYINPIMLLIRKVRFFKTKYTIYIVRFWVYITKKLWIYKQVSHIWRKYILKHFR